MTLSAKPKLLLCTLILLLLTGCGKELIYLEDILPDTGTVVTDEGPGQEETVPGWQPMPEYDAEASRTVAFNSYENERFVETAHCVVFDDNRDIAYLKYLNKATGTVHVLCGDPLCKHEDCMARITAYDVMSSVVYAPEYGRLCRIRTESPHPIDISYKRIRYEIVSIDIDNMDFTIHRHFISKPGDRIRFMRYDGGKLYFIMEVMLDDGTDEWKADWELYVLSLEDDSVEAVGRMSTGGFIVRDGTAYYRKGALNFYALCSLDLTNRTETKLYEPQGQADYWCCNGRFFCYTVSDSCMRELGLDGNVVRELFRADESDPDYRHRWAVGPDGTVYEYLQTYSADTEFVADNGKIFRWVNGERELYADLGESKCINNITPIGDRLFVLVKPNNHGTEFYYVVDGAANKVSK